MNGLHGTNQAEADHAVTISQERVPGITVPGPTQFDFISEYAHYADIIEAPRIMHEVVAMQIIATVLNRNGVCITRGGLTSPLDLWTVLLSGSGCGRSTLLTLAQPILQKAELRDIKHLSQWGSSQAVYQYFADHPSGLFVWGEMSEKLKLLNDVRFRGTKEWLTDRYDNLDAPEAIRYRQTGIVERDTPPITFTTPPRINILASSSENWFFENLVSEDSSGGFLPRWLLIRAGNSARLVPVPRIPDQNAVEPLAIRLQQIAQMRGPADTSLIEEDYATWYVQTHARFAGQPNSPLASAYFGRHRVQILKLALIFEVSSLLSLRISRASWARAVEFGDHLEQTIFSLLSTGMSGGGYTQKQMEERIRGAGEQGFSLSEFTRAFQHTDKRQRDSYLSTLAIQEAVYLFKRFTSGRPVIRVVHRDFIESYRAQHPEDGAVPIKYG